MQSRVGRYRWANERAFESRVKGHGAARQVTITSKCHRTVDSGSARQTQSSSSPAGGGAAPLLAPDAEDGATSADAEGLLASPSMASVVGGPQTPELDLRGDEQRQGEREAVRERVVARKDWPQSASTVIDADECSSDQRWQRGKGEREERLAAGKGEALGRKCGSPLPSPSQTTGGATAEPCRHDAAAAIPRGARSIGRGEAPLGGAGRRCGRSARGARRPFQMRSWRGRREEGGLLRGDERTTLPHDSRIRSQTEETAKNDAR